MTEVCRGRTFVIECARDATGRKPAEDFLNELQSDPNRERDHAGLMKSISYMAEHGQIRNEEHFKLIPGTDPTLFEFKKHQIRVFGCFNGQGRALLTHGAIKKKQKLDPADIERAYRIRTEHLKAQEKKR